MTRGRPSTTGISGAVPVARARGEFVPIGNYVESVFSFLLRAPAGLIFVRVQYVTSLYLPVADAGVQHRDLIAQLRSRCCPAGAELWLYNKHGSYRYFRIAEGGIVELDSAGNVAYPAGPATGLVQEAAGAGGGKEPDAASGPPPGLQEQPGSGPQRDTGAAS